MADGMQYFDLGTVFFLVAAVIIFWQLRNVLGRRTGNERPPRDPFTVNRRTDDAKAPPAKDNVIALPRPVDAASQDFQVIDAVAKPGTPLNDGLRAVRAADPAFEPGKFLDGAKMAYEMIVAAFADGDRKTLKNLLSREVYDGFSGVIAERESRGEKVQSSFIGVEKAEIVGAEIKGTEARLTVRIVSQLISATVDKGGTIIDGDPETVAEVKDVWTFVRDTRNRDPNWKLVATEAED
jgi:predicted lipid-binding transport protein (Tim44 family)